MIKRYLVLVLVFGFAISISAQIAGFTFIQISDPQYGFLDDNKSYEKEQDIFEKTIKKINFISPAFVAITGDFVHDTESQEQIDAFKSDLRQIDKNIPVYLIPGNHDIGSDPTPESQTKYLQNYNSPLYSTFNYNGVRFIFLNSTIIKSENAPLLEEEQFKWLESLTKTKKMPTIIFAHHPFFLKSFDEEDNHAAISNDKRKKYWDLFKKLDVTDIFAGHLHDNFETEHDGINMVTTSSLGRQLGNADSGIRVIKVVPEGKNKIKVTSNYYTIDNIPLN